MTIQIYTMQTPEEALKIVDLGVDHLGITPSHCGLPGEINYEIARSITDALKGKAVSVALSVDTNLDTIKDMVEAVQPDILHLCGPEDGLTFEDLNSLRELLPGTPIMQAISVDGPEAIENACAFQGFADYLILDTQTEDVIGIGASGRTHDWNISRKIVQSVRIPVILAGGLTEDNVAEAIQHVRPWAVDSLTHTNHYLPDGQFYKSLARIEAFVSHAKGA